MLRQHDLDTRMLNHPVGFMLTPGGTKFPIASRRLRFAAVVVLGTAVIAAVILGGRWWLNKDGDAASRALRVDSKDAVVGFDPSFNARTEVGLINAAAHGDHEGLRTVALAELNSTDADVRWAAIYALSLIVTQGDGEGVSALRASLASTDLDEQLAAAGGLVAVGEKAAVPVLIALLESSKTTRYIVTPAWRMARGLLLSHVAQDLGLRDADDRRKAAAAKPAWQAWWAERGALLSWNPDVGKFQ